MFGKSNSTLSGGAEGSIQIINQPATMLLLNDNFSLGSPTGTFTDKNGTTVNLIASDFTSEPRVGTLLPTEGKFVAKLIYDKNSYFYNYEVFDKWHASITPMAGVTYSTDISSWDATTMKEISWVISNNSDITNVTSDVYIDSIDSENQHYHLRIGNGSSNYTTKTMTIDGGSYPFVILGFNHDELASATYYGATTATGKAGITWQMENCSSNKKAMNTSRTNAGGWTSSNMRTSIMATLLSGFNFKNAVAPVLKKTSDGSQSSTINIDTDNLFLLSEIEIFGSTTYSKAGEGTQYAWYKAGNTKVKKVGGSANDWWERSPYGGNSVSFCTVTTINSAGYNAADGSIGVAVVFCS